jgi:hypothetical protein
LFLPASFFFLKLRPPRRTDTASKCEDEKEKPASLRFIHDSDGIIAYEFECVNIMDLNAAG